MKKKDTLIKIAIAAAILIVATALVIVNAKGENQRNEEPPDAAETEAESPDVEATEEAKEDHDKEENHSQADKKPALNITGHVSYALPQTALIQKATVRPTASASYTAWNPVKLY